MIYIYIYIFGKLLVTKLKPCGAKTQNRKLCHREDSWLIQYYVKVNTSLKISNMRSFELLYKKKLVSATE